MSSKASSEDLLYQRIPVHMPAPTPVTALPSQIWIISTLEITVSVASRNFVLTQLSSYSLRNQRIESSHGEGYWAPPFVAYPVPIRFSPPSTVGSLLKACTDAIKEEVLTRDAEQLAYRLGLRDVTMTPREGFLEIKVSPRSPEMVKAFYIRRFGVTGVSSDCLPNLADRESMMGYLFLELTRDGAQDAVRRKSDVHRRAELWVAGKPLQSNLEAVVGDDRMRAELAHSAIQLSMADFYNRDTGLIVACDLSRFGAALSNARTSMGGFLGTGQDAAEAFTSVVAAALQRFVAVIGTTQVQIAGDGLVAALSDRLGDPLTSRVTNVLKAWAEVVAVVDKLNGLSQRPSFSVGSRFALHYGEYRHGRIAGPASVVPGFDGAAVVEAARFEQGLASWLAAHSNYGDHVGIVSSAVIRELGPDFVVEGLSKAAESITVTSKEFTGSGALVFFDETRRNDSHNAGSGRPKL